MKKIPLIIFLILLSFLSNAANVKPLRTFSIDQEGPNFVKKPGSFIVTEDDRVIIFDLKGSDVKTYDMNGQLLDVFGRKGMGPHEFVRPFISSYNASIFSFVDLGRRMVFLYKRKAGSKPEFLDKFLCLEMADDLHLMDDQNFLIGGFKTNSNQEDYSLYIYNFKKKKYDFIIPTEVSYGFKSKKTFQKEYLERIMYIDARQFSDYHGDNIFWVWTGDLKINKFNKKTKEITTFGKKTKRYIKPFLTPEIKRAYDQRDHRTSYKLQYKMSYIREIFTMKSNRVGVAYIGPLDKNEGLNVMLQIYDGGNGKLLSEFELLYAKASHHYELYFYFRKSDNRFYVLDTETTKDFDQLYQLHEFKIEE